MSATDVEGRFEASLEWDGNFNNEEDKTTSDQLLSRDWWGTSGWTNTLGSCLNGNKISFLALLLLYFRYLVLIPTYINPNNDFNSYY